MSQKPILLIGAGGHARACIDVIEQAGRFKIAGVTGLANEVGGKVLGYPVLGVDADLPQLLKEFPSALVAVGQIKTAALRIRLFELLERNGCVCSAVVSPRAYVSPHATLGAGTIVMHGAVINAGAVVGRNCIINSQALVEHDVVIGDHCHVSTAAVLNGEVSIGAGSFIGSGSHVLQCVRIGADCLIGMGQSVFAAVPDGTHLPIAKLAP